MYIKSILLALLIVIEIVVCAQAFSGYSNIYFFIALIVCCVLLGVLEGINSFVIRQFAVKMVFFGFDSALLLTICVLTGNSFLSTLYCIVLTEFYMNIESTRHKTVLFGLSCGLFTVSFIVGTMINGQHPGLYDVIINISSGLLFGLLAIVLDFIIVQFIISFYRNNKKLSAALKEADESRAQLSEAYEELTRTKVYEERNRIAKDIHDNAGHSMTTVIMQTEAAKLLIDTNPAEAKNRIISANIQAKNALEQMRESVHLLAGREQTLTLREELEEIIAQTIDGTSIKARCDIADLHVDADQARFLCNSLKECLANGVRHGKATAFYIELKIVSGNINMLVSDNGVGVSGDVLEGFGLRGMREKAEAMGGSCYFSGEDGFEVEINLPYKEKIND